ncbi:MAG: hypothetical protein QOJ01_1166 [Solirubrobacterales bacterium]|jgi:hypothetical protein|nr:hypothetical protein [Solirubrobacterales bacterium]
MNQNTTRRSPRLFSRSLVAAAVLALGAGSAVPALASASGPAPTKVSIIPESDGFYGYVSSAKTQKCANNRKVVLFKQLGSVQDPHSDQKIGMDIAQPNGDGVMWNTGNSGHMPGKFYAHVNRTPDCQSASSPSVKMTN